MVNKKENAGKPEVEKIKKPVGKQSSKASSTAAKKKTSTSKAAAKAKSEVKAIKTTASTPAKEKNAVSSANNDRGVIALGIGMLVMGLLLLGGRFLRIPFGQFLWPFIFIIPGVLVFFTAVSTNRSSGEGLAIVGGILSMLGFVFLMQTVTGLWASWAYIWALIAPTSIGLSQMVYGNMKADDAVAATGWKLTKIGLSILAVGFVFFELILGISGFGLARLGLPVFPMILIFLGGFVILRSVIRSK